MNPEHAIFIWISYALTLAVLAWNALAPWRRRHELRRWLAEGADAEHSQ